MSLNYDKLRKVLEAMPMKFADDSLKKNASAAQNVGLEVRVTREYDGIGIHDRKDECQWCIERCGKNMTLQEAYAKGSFQRHPGCGCKITYISKKGIITVQNKKGEWAFAGEVEKLKSIGLEPDFYADEVFSRIAPYLEINPEKIFEEAKAGGIHSGCYKQAIGKTKKQLEDSIKNHVNEVEEHEWKLQHPKEKMDKGDPNNPKDVAHTVAAWKRHRRRNAQQASIELKIWRDNFAKK